MRWFSPPWCTLPTELSGRASDRPSPRRAHAGSSSRGCAPRCRRASAPGARPVGRSATARARARCTWSTPRPPMRSTPPEPAPDTICRSPESVAFATFHPSPTSPTRWSSGTTAPIEEHLVEVDLAGDVPQRPHVDAGLVQVDEEVRDALPLRDVGIGAGEQHAEVGEVRPRGPHLLAGHEPVVAVALGARRERREVGARAGLAEQLAPHLFVAHDRRQEAQALLLGAVREQRGRGEVEPERVEPAEVVRPQLRLDRGARSRARGRARRTRPARSARRAPKPRTSDTTPRTSARGRTARIAAAPPASGRRRSTHAARARRPTRARRRRRPPAPCRYRPRAAAVVFIARRTPAGAARGTRRAPRGSPRCATRARARTPRWRGAARATARRPGAAATSRARAPPSDPARARRRASATASSSSAAGTARWIAPHAAASVPVSFRPSSNSSRARTSPTRRGNNHVAPLSGVNPRSANGSQNVASSAAIVKSAASASWKPMPGGPAAHRAHDRRLHAREQRDRAGAPGREPPLDAARARSQAARSALRATMSAPPQKCSPRAVEQDHAHALVGAGGTHRVDQARPSSLRRSRCACRAGRG